MRLPWVSRRRLRLLLEEWENAALRRQRKAAALGDSREALMEGAYRDAYRQVAHQVQPR